MVGQGHAHVTAWCVVHNQVESTLALEGEVEADDKLVRRQTQHVALGAGVPHQVLGEDLVLLEDLHRVVLLRRFALFVH